MKVWLPNVDWLFSFVFSSTSLWTKKNYFQKKKKKIERAIVVCEKVKVNHAWHSWRFDRRQFNFNSFTNLKKCGHFIFRQNRDVTFPFSGQFNPLLNKVQHKLLLFRYFKSFDIFCILFILCIMCLVNKLLQYNTIQVVCFSKLLSLNNTVFE